MKKLYYSYFPSCKILPLFYLLIVSCLNTNAQWTKTQGPPGINVNAFYNKDNFLFAGTSSKGVFRSQDKGASWHPANVTIQNATVFSFASDSSYLYAGTSKGVYRSPDEGLTWQPANSGIQNQSVSAMIMGGGYLFAGTVGSGVYKSDDHGNSWSDANGGALNSSYIVSMCYVTGLNLLIVEGDNYLFKSTNAGNTWFVDQGNTAFFVIKHFLVIGDTVLASARNGVFHSYNGGATFSKFLPVETDDYTDLLGFSFSNGVIYTGDKTGMFSSRDYGVNWTSIPAISGLRSGTRFNNYFIQTGNIFLMGMDELGVFRSLDTGKTWKQSLQGFTSASSIDNNLLAIGDTIITGTHSDGIYGTINKGNQWRKFGTRNNRDTLSNAIVRAILYPSPGILLAGTGGDGLYRSSNYGKTWTHITEGLPYIQAGNYEADEAMAISSSNILLATSNGIFYSKDTGLTWKASNLTGDRISAFSIAANSDIAVAGVVEGVSPFQSGFYRSTNKGVTWTFVAGILDDVVSLASDGIDHFYGGAFFSNWRSGNNGISWQSIGNGIPDNTGGYSVKVVDVNNVFIGNDKGIYFSADQGNNFTNISQGFDPAPNNTVQGIAANSEYLYAGLYLNGVWKRPLSDLGITLSPQKVIPNNILKPDLKDEEDLLFVYPNPATTQAAIQYKLYAAGEIQLIIKDQTGRTFKQINETASEGIHVKKINVQQFLPGIYFVQLSINGRQYETKFAVTK